jgi:hypothetical protein
VALTGWFRAATLDICFTLVFSARWVGAVRVACPHTPTPTTAPLALLSSNLSGYIASRAFIYDYFLYDDDDEDD